MPHKLINKFIGFFGLCLSCFLFASCGGFDEQDVTIIAYLKINDLLENKYSGNAEEVITENIGQALLLSDNWFESLMFANTIEKEIDNMSLADIEDEISQSLWEYVAACYPATTIPSKAQNTETGTYYSISELKALYPDYKEVELEDFIPMVLISRVDKEDVFDGLFGDGDGNLKTLYLLQAYKQQHINAVTDDETSCADDR